MGKRTPPPADGDTALEQLAEAPVVVHLGKWTVTLGRPPSLTLAVEVVGACGANGLRGRAACLGVAWRAGPTADAPQARYDRCGYDPMRYGGQVFDDLVSRGIGIDLILRAGEAARLHLAGGIPGEQEVREAEGN